MWAFVNTVGEYVAKWMIGSAEEGSPMKEAGVKVDISNKMNSPSMNDASENTMKAFCMGDRAIVKAQSDNIQTTNNYSHNVGLNLVLGAFGVFGALFMYVHRVEQKAEKKKEKEKERKEAEGAVREKFIEICALEDKVRIVVRSFNNFEEFLTSYAWQRAAKKVGEDYPGNSILVPTEIQQISVEHMKDIELYRKAAMTFFKNEMIKDMGFPTSGEIFVFVTFHWAIYQVNNVSANYKNDALKATRFAHQNKIKWIDEKQPDLADKVLFRSITNSGKIFLKFFIS